MQYFWVATTGPSLAIKLGLDSTASRLTVGNSDTKGRKWKFSYWVGKLRIPKTLETGIGPFYKFTRLKLKLRLDGHKYISYVKTYLRRHPGSTYVSLLRCLAALLSGPDLFFVSAGSGQAGLTRLYCLDRCPCLPCFLVLSFSFSADSLPFLCSGAFSIMVITNSVWVPTVFLHSRGGWIHFTDSLSGPFLRNWLTWQASES